GAGLPTAALITDMNQPLASAAGNGLEMRNAVDFLAGRHADPRLREVTLALGGEIALMTGRAATPDAARRLLDAALDSGRALERFALMVAGLGGPADFTQYLDRYLAPAPIVRDVMAPGDGVVARIDTRAV